MELLSLASPESFHGKEFQICRLNFKLQRGVKYSMLAASRSINTVKGSIQNSADARFFKSLFAKI